MRILLFNFFLFLSGSFFSCSRSEPPKEPGADEQPPASNNIPASQKGNYKDFSGLKGKAIPSFFTQGHEDASYSLYLPPNYDSSKSWPLVIFFDPDANGFLPVNKYSNAAASSGFILAGSNHSKNGQTMEEAMKEYRTLINEITSTFNISGNMIFTAGFSGGSVAATQVSYSNPEVAGVIACSGYSPLPKGLPERNFLLFGFAGINDFHFGNMRMLRDNLKSSGIKNSFDFFKGDHAWPPEKNFGLALNWLRLKSMQLGRIPKNENEIQQKFQEFTIIKKKASTSRDSIDWYYSLIKSLDYFNGLLDVTNEKALVTGLENSTALKKHLSIENAAIALEQQEVNIFSQAWGKQTFAWWAKEIKRIREKARTEKNEYFAGAYNRILGYLGVGAYSNCARVHATGNIPLLHELVKVYEYLEPKNPEQNFFFAVVYASEGNTSAAMGKLNAALANGFKDASRIESESSFSKMKNDPAFISILRKLNGDQGP